MDNEITLNIRKRSTLKFIIFLIITCGWYLYVWIWKLVNDLNNLDSVQEKKLNFWKIMALPIVLDIYDIYNTIITWDNDGFSSWDKFYIKINTIIYLVISIILLRKIEEYAQKKYNVSIEHSGLGLFFFTTIYTNFAINNFGSRVQKALNEQRENNNV